MYHEYIDKTIAYGIIGNHLQNDFQKLVYKILTVRQVAFLLHASRKMTVRPVAPLRL